MDQPKKKESGAAGRKRRKLEKKVDTEREHERGGLNAQWLALLERIGPPPLDAVENSEWANNLAAAMAFITAQDDTLPMKERFAAVLNAIDKVGKTHAKAVTAARIKKIRKAAGLPDEKTQDAVGMVKVGRGASLRARRGAGNGAALSGSVPGIPAQDDARGNPEGGRPVGSDS